MKDMHHLLNNNSVRVDLLTIPVLYVDDEPALLEIAKLFLERKKEFVVTAAESGTKALELFKPGAFEAIVADYQMPGMDGIEFLKKIRAIDKKIPFILFTGKGREEIAVEAWENGASFYMQKGGDPKTQFAELVHKINTSVDHRHAEAQVEILNRVYKVLSSTNQLIVRIDEKKHLLDEICRIAVEVGGFTMAWAGFASLEKHLIEPVASCGKVEGYLDTIAISIDDVPRGRGPTGTAFREGKYHICNDIEHDAKMAPWRNGAMERGFRSVAAFPFALGTSNAGVFTFYASETGFFNDSIVRLLKEQSLDISYALVNFDKEERRVVIENELKISELQYRRLFETAQDAILILDGVTGKILDANKFIQDMLGYPREYFIGKHLWELGFFQDQAFAEKAFSKLKDEGYIRYDDLPLETKDGKSIAVEFISNAYTVGEAKIIQSNIRDITDRKRAEKSLAISNRKLNLVAAITRHDIMNELMVLSGSLDLAREKMREPDGISLIDTAAKAADNIRYQVEFTREYEDLGKTVPVWGRVSEIARAAAAQALGKTVAFEIPHDRLEIYADPLLPKVFYNLFVNSMKHGGNVTRIQILYEHSGTGIKIIVTDDGSGIKDKEHLFERGFGKNTGLGLFLIAEILSITGISISETGNFGSGARFEILVPEGGFRFAD